MIYVALVIVNYACYCRLHRCLQKASRMHGDPLADTIGHLFFNIIGINCFNLEEREYCTESSFWGNCLRSEWKKVAVFNEDLTYEPLVPAPENRYQT